MQSEAIIPVGVLLSFLAVLARIGGTLVWIRFPGFEMSPGPAKVVLVVGLAIALFPALPAMSTIAPTLSQIVVLLLSELALGTAAGLLLGYLMDAFSFAGQLIAAQAGFSYATTIDPTSQTDNGLLPSLMQLLAGLLFFALGLDRLLIRAFADSLVTCPPGTFSVSRSIAGGLVTLGREEFRLALRLAMPVMALLLMIDLSLAFLSRVSAQMQMLSLAFPVKILAALLLLAMTCVFIPTVFGDAAERTLRSFHQLLVNRR